jgi:hypothetical protein
MLNTATQWAAVLTLCLVPLRAASAQERKTPEKPSDVMGTPETRTATVGRDPAECKETQAVSNTLTSWAPPRPVTMSCSAQAACLDGSTVSCVGNVSCFSQCSLAICDGVDTRCGCGSVTPPAVCIGTGFEDQYCDCRKCGGSEQWCRCCWCINGGDSCFANC